LRTAAVRLGQDDVDVLSRRTDGDPAEAVGGDVVADFEAERVAPMRRAAGVVGMAVSEHYSFRPRSLPEPLLRLGTYLFGVPRRSGVD